ncbi:hypothetical protein CRG98_029106, partial [Punica granatum]
VSCCLTRIELVFSCFVSLILGHCVASRWVSWINQKEQGPTSVDWEEVASIYERAKSMALTFCDNV